MLSLLYNFANYAALPKLKVSPKTTRSLTPRSAVKHPCIRLHSQRRTRMNPSGPSIQQIQDSLRATWMAGDLCVVSRRRSRCGIPLSRRQRRPRLSRRTQSYLDPQRLPASDDHPHLGRSAAFSRFVAQLDAEHSIEDRQSCDQSAGYFWTVRRAEAIRILHSWRGLRLSARRAFRAQFPNNMEGEPG